MTKKYLSASILSCICMTVTGCGAGASNAVVSPAESIGKEVISADASAEYTTPATQQIQMCLTMSENTCI